MTAEWLPDWPGETVVVVCSGRSARLAPIDLAKGRFRVVTVNESWRLAPWADVAYGCDWPWWAHRGPTPEQFPGLRVVGRRPSDSEARHQLNAAQRDYMAELLSLPVSSDERREPPFLPMEGPVTGGGMSGFQVVGRLVQAKVARILLVGVDCTPGHWHGQHSHPNGSNPPPSRLKAWVAQWTSAAPELGRLGVEVINCNPESMFDRPLVNGEPQPPCYKRMTLAEALG